VGARGRFLVTQMADAPNVVDGLVRGGISQSTTAPWHFEEDVRRYREVGWGAMGVWLQKIADDSMPDIRLPPPLPSDDRVEWAVSTVRTVGMRVSHVVGSGFYTEASEEARARNVDHTVAAIRVAERLAAPCLVVIPGRLNGLTRRRAFDLSAAAISEALERTEGSPVCLALEPVTEVDFVSTLDEALDLADLVDDERVGVLPDSFHALRDPGATEAIQRAAGRILCVHVADAESDGRWARLPPAEGRLDLAGFISEIAATGYQGTFDVELISNGASNAEASDLLARCAAGMRVILRQLALPGTEPRGG
jgi:sugar phosphate isomerase/epimerase